MEYTEGQKVQFKSMFAARRLKQRVLTALLIGLFIGFAALGDRNQDEVLGYSAAIWAPMFFLIVAGAVIFSFINWKCPACNKYLGKNTNPRYCSKCGIELR